MGNSEVIVWLKDMFQPNKYTINQIESLFSFGYLSSYHFSDLKIKSQVLNEAKQLASHKEIDLGNIYHHQIEVDFLPSCSIRFVSDQSGYGLFAEETLNIGDFAGKYTGMIKENCHYFEFNHYLFQYPVLDEIGRNYVIDAASGNLTRFINHSYQPNLKPVYAYLNGLYHLIFLVIRPIRKNEQLSYDYGQNYWNIRGQPEKL
ncbi:MAG: SET domain-containing protein-lysine N-methyltransferase [Chlamydiales bacterium]|nr:SET domain-containing protein-lysine N-methyltransferase [Chlamydiales bacterium]